MSTPRLFSASTINNPFQVKGSGILSVVMQLVGKSIAYVLWTPAWLGEVKRMRVCAWQKVRDSDTESGVGVLLFLGPCLRASRRTTLPSVGWILKRHVYFFPTVELWRPFYDKPMVKSRSLSTIRLVLNLGVLVMTVWIYEWKSYLNPLLHGLSCV